MNKQATFCVLKTKNLCKNYSGLETFNNASCSMIKQDTFIITRNNAQKKSIFIKNTGEIA